MFKFTYELAIHFLMGWSIFHIILNETPSELLTSSLSSSSSSSSSSSQNRLFDILGAISFIVKSRLALDSDEEEGEEEEHQDWYRDLDVVREGEAMSTTESCTESCTEGCTDNGLSDNGHNGRTNDADGDGRRKRRFPQVGFRKLSTLHEKPFKRFDSFRSVKSVRSVRSVDPGKTVDGVNGVYGPTKGLPAIPNDVARIMARYLDYPSAATLARTCKGLRLAGQFKLWREVRISGSCLQDDPWVRSFYSPDKRPIPLFGTVEGAREIATLLRNEPLRVETARTLVLDFDLKQDSGQRCNEILRLLGPHLETVEIRVQRSLFVLGDDSLALKRATREYLAKETSEWAKLFHGVTLSRVTSVRLFTGQTVLLDLPILLRAVPALQELWICAIAPDWQIMPESLAGHWFQPEPQWLRGRLPTGWKPHQSLRRVHLSEHTSRQERILGSLCAAARNIDEVTCTNNEECDESLQILGDLPGLRRLNLLGCGELTESGLHRDKTILFPMDFKGEDGKMVKSFPELRELNIHAEFQPAGGWEMLRPDLQHLPKRLERVVLVNLRGGTRTQIQRPNEHLVPEFQSQSGRRFDGDLLPPLPHPVHLQTTPSEILFWQKFMPELFDPHRNNLVELTTLIHQADAEPFPLSTLAVPSQRTPCMGEVTDGVDENTVASGIMIRQYTRSKKENDEVDANKPDKVKVKDNADAAAAAAEVSLTHLRILSRLDLEHPKDVFSSTGQCRLVEKKWFDYAVVQGVGIVPKEILQWVYDEAGEGMYWTKGGKGLTLPDEAWSVLDELAGKMPGETA